MDKSTKKSGIIKANQVENYSSYTFLNFNEKKELEDRITHLETLLKREKRFRLEDKDHFEKTLLEIDVKFNDRLTQEKTLAYQKGITDGSATGLKQGQESIFTATEYLKKCATELLSCKDQFIQEIEESAVKLSLAVATKILQKSIEVDPEVVLSSIHTGLTKISDKSLVVLKISEKDLATVKGNINQIKSSFDDIGQLRVIIDDKITTGGVIIETNSGDIDARLEVQLEEIEKKLLNGD